MSIAESSVMPSRRLRMVGGEEDGEGPSVDDESEGSHQILPAARWPLQGHFVGRGQNRQRRGRSRPGSTASRRMRRQQLPTVQRILRLREEEARACQLCSMLEGGAGWSSRSPSDTWGYAYSTCGETTSTTNSDTQPSSTFYRNCRICGSRRPFHFPIDGPSAEGEEEKGAAAKIFLPLALSRPWTIGKVLTAGLLVCLLVGLWAPVTKASPLPAVDSRPPVRHRASHSVEGDEMARAQTIPLEATTRLQRQLMAYDCTEPHDVQAVSLLHDPDIRTCQEQELKKRQSESQYLLIQKVNKVKMRVRSCRVMTTRLAYACGAASHTAFGNRESFFNHPWSVDVDRCRDIWENQKYGLWHFENGREEQAVERGKSNFLTFERTGGTMNGGNDVLCKGGKFPYWEQKSYKSDEGYATTSMTSMIVTDYVQVDLFEKDIYIPLDEPGSIILPYANGKASCDPFKQHGCEVHDGTLTWGKLKEEEVCPFFLLRRVTGINVDEHTAQGEVHETFVSHTNDSMVRLRKVGDAVSRCGAVVQPTNYPQLFLSSELSNPRLNRPIDPSDVSAFLHATMADDFLFHKAQENLAAAVLGLQRHQCELDRTRALTAHATLLSKQKAVKDGDTAHIGGGIFITSSGEAGRLYHCREVIVEALPHTQGCHNALPVRMAGEDERHLQEILTEEGADADQILVPTMYLEPRSRLLTTVATPIACVPQFAPLYRNRQGEWLQMTQHGVQLAPAPKDPRKDFKESYFHVKKSDLPSPGKRSIYDVQTLVAAMYYRAAKGMEAMTGAKHYIGTLAGKAGKMEESSMFPQAEMHFDTSVSLWDALGLSNFRRLWSWYQDWANLCNAIVAMYLLYLTLCYFVNIYNQLCIEQEQETCGIKVFRAFLPSLWAVIVLGRLSAADTKGPCYGCASACLSIRQTRQARAEEKAARQQAFFNPVPPAAAPPLYPRMTPPPSVGPAPAAAPAGAPTTPRSPPKPQTEEQNVPTLVLMTSGEQMVLHDPAPMLARETQTSRKKKGPAPKPPVSSSSPSN